MNSNEDKNFDEKLLKKAKAERYYDMLHPQSEITSVEEEFNNSRDLIFIYDHIDIIDDLYNTNMKKGSMADINGWNEQQTIQYILKKVKSEHYFNMLYPKYKYSSDYGIYVMDDQKFIYEHIDEIDDEYRKYMQGNNGENTEKNKEDIIREIISKIERPISTEQIGKATKGAPIKAKREATQVEIGEKDQEETRRSGI